VTQLPSGWASAQLQDVASTQLGRMLSASRETGAYARPYLRNRDVQWGHINVTDLPTMDFGPQDAIRFRLTPGDVLVCEGGEVGRAAVWEGQLEECYYQKALHRIRTSEALMPTYLRYLFEHYGRTKAFEHFISGSTIAHLPQEDLRHIPVNLPPRREQERIVAAMEEQFSRVDAGVAALSRIRRDLKRLRAAVLQAAVTGLILGADAHSSLDWQQRPLGEVLQEIHAGKSFKCEERPARADEWGVIKVSAMTWGHFRENENKTVMPGRIIDERLEIRPGDLLVSRANTIDYVGAVVHVGECRPRLLLSDKSLRLVPRADVLPEWLVIALRSRGARRYIEAVATGTSDSMRNISQPKLRAINVPVPSLTVQTVLVQEVSRLMSLIDRLDLTLLSGARAADALRSSILAAGFSGKLVPQNPDDESASVLLERIAGEWAASNGHRSRTRAIRLPKAMA
jgi:type I restriction enzyme S subunit